ncbi:alkaline-phosphatase-like protein [Ilyonectria destructans]|nr:alkaline-phosphatase-like protein [Ilyonectria destructans]
MSAAFVPYCFSVIVVSLAFTKLVHLYIHAATVPAASFIVYLPSFLLPDALVIFTARLVFRRERGWLSFALCVAGCLMTLVILCAASSQLGFFYETGNEVEWEDAGSFAHDAEGIKVLMSGLTAVLASGFAILLVAWFPKAFLYRAVGMLLVGIGAPLVFVWRSAVRRPRSRNPRPRRRVERQPDWSEDSEDYSDYESDFETDSGEAVALVYGEKWMDAVGRSPNCFRKTSSWVLIAGFLIFLAVTSLVRPSMPYNHISTTLPFPLLDMFQPKPDHCAEQGLMNDNEWPFPELTNTSKWEYPSDTSRGWAPGTNNMVVNRYRKSIPDWLPDPIPPGFSKWASRSSKTRASSNVTATNKFVQSGHSAHDDKILECDFPVINDTFYNPVGDPMKITNLDTDILQVLQTALSNNSVKIKHVALIMMESLREELFPIQQGSDIHRFIMEANDEDERDEANARVSRLSPNAEKITGKPGNFMNSNGSTYDRDLPEWNDTTTPGFGGINIVGAFTTSSVSTKSLAAIHCGAWPMPVDKFEESETESYQPCLPQVLELFNRMKDNRSTSDFRQQEWYPAFFQSVTDGYDRQAKFDKKIGFKNIVTKTRIDNDATEDDDLETINYFGYPETTLISHMEDYIKEAKAEGKRMFFSHFTSTTHHPWALPKWFPSTKYMDTKGTMRWHKDFDKYLNTVRFNDAWLGEMMQMFDDHGISNETLVVFVGDHGQAFKEDVSKTGTYENGHISNFRVPITFRHPHLPRVQYNANATSLSILPTILDLLINTGSLNEDDTAAASDLVQDYEGQSFLREYKASHNGRRAWNFGIINAGGRMLSVTSADAPWRLVMPLDAKSVYTLTDLENDPLELDPLLKWSVGSLASSARRKYNSDASEWVIEAEAIARWWGLERKRLWGYQGE